MINWRKRFPEWREVARLYHEQRGPLPVWHLLKAVWAGPVPRKVWRLRFLKACKTCPVACRAQQVMPDGRKWRMNACAGPGGSGCGCYLPFLLLSANPGREGCWYYDNSDGTEGWPAYHWPSLWSRLWAPIAFLLGK